MNAKLTTALMAVVILLASVSAMAQVEANVKILPAADAGIIKLLYAYNSEKPVTVSFYDDALISSDRVKGVSSPHGFLKKYDIKNITSSVFWIEIKSIDLEVTYKMEKSKSGKFIPTLERTIYKHEVVAKNN